MTKKNKEISKTLSEIADLIEIKGGSSSLERFRERAYRKAVLTLMEMDHDISKIYEEKGINGIIGIKGIGKSIAQKIEEYLKEQKIKYLEDLRKETSIRQIVTYYFKTKNVNLEQLKKSARKKEIVYSRYTKPAKQLLELAGSIDKAKKAISIVAEWANSRNLDYSIETVFKKWLELDRLRPKEIIKKPFYDNNPLIWSESRKKWFVIDETNTWLEFAGKESDIEWRVIK
jgi:hypothetical protein